MLLEVLMYFFQWSNNMISVNTSIRKRNVRRDLLALVKHKMGSSKWDTKVEKVECILCNQVWNGRNLFSPWPTYINICHDAHGDLTRDANYIPYGVTNEHVCINWLIKSTHTRYQRVIATKPHILSNVQILEDFELTANFINLAAPLKSPVSNNQSIISLCGSEENFIIPNKWNTGV